MATVSDFLKQNDPTTWSACFPATTLNASTCGGPTGLVAQRSTSLCSNGSIYANNDYCKSWCMNQAGTDPFGRCPALNTSIPTYCNTKDGFASTYCQNWCRDNPGQCNKGADLYCASNPTSKLCSCIKSPMNNVQGLIPECYDSNCRNYGYKTYSLASIGGCPDYIDCKTSLQIKDILGNVDLTGVKIEQNCGGTGGVNVDVPDTSSNTTSSETSLISNFSNKLGLTPTMFLIIIISFILLIVIGVFIISGGNISFPSFGFDEFSLYEEE